MAKTATAYKIPLDGPITIMPGNIEMSARMLTDRLLSVRNSVGATHSLWQAFHALNTACINDDQTEAIPSLATAASHAKKQALGNISMAQRVLADLTKYIEGLTVNEKRFVKFSKKKAKRLAKKMKKKRRKK